jgi:hypothetical protein
VQLNKNVPIRPIGTRFGNTISYFEPGAQEYNWDIFVGQANSIAALSKCHSVLYQIEQRRERGVLQNLLPLPCQLLEIAQSFLIIWSNIGAFRGR